VSWFGFPSMLCTFYYYFRSVDS